MSSGHANDRNYVITHNWLGKWEAACDRCGEERDGSITNVFALLWKHRNCTGEVTP